MSNPTEQSALDERQKYVLAWNHTMIKIWREQITLLGIIDTGALLRSPLAIRTQADGRFTHIELSESFLEYGLYQDYGTGKETPRGNPGDIGHTKTRKRRQWFSKKYYASVMNIKDFMSDSLGHEFQGIMADFANRLNHRPL